MFSTVYLILLWSKKIISIISNLNFLNDSEYSLLWCMFSVCWKECAMCVLSVVVYSNVHALYILSDFYLYFVTVAESEMVNSLTTVSLARGLECRRAFLCSCTFLSFQQGLNASDREGVSFHTSLSPQWIHVACSIGASLALCIWLPDMSLSQCSCPSSEW